MEPGEGSLTLVTEEAIELLHDCRLHDLSEEGVLLSQLLGIEVFPTTCGPLVVVEEVDEGCIGRLGKQLLIDIREEPEEMEGGPVKGRRWNRNPSRNCQTGRDRPAQVGFRSRVGTSDTLEGHA